MESLLFDHLLETKKKTSVSLCCCFVITTNRCETIGKKDVTYIYMHTYDDADVMVVGGEGWAKRLENKNTEYYSGTVPVSIAAADRIGRYS